MRKMIFLSLVVVASVSWNTANDSKANLAERKISESIKNNFKGVWVNEDEETRSMTKCEIRYEEDRFYIHLWGACHPEDCDWGETATDELDEKTQQLTVNWDQGFVERTQTLVIKNGKLVLTTNNHYKDDSGRPDNSIVDIFIKK